MTESALKMKGDKYLHLKQKFKEREEQTSIQQALVYLKLRQFQCDNRRSLIFSKKKEKCIDGTINKDGPAGFRKLEVVKPESKLMNGWLRGEKHKYMGTTGYTDFLKKHESAEKKSITSYNQKSRNFQEELRKARSKSTVTIDMMRPKESIEKIGIIKEEASKERQNRNMYVEYGGVKLDQTTKNFFKQAQYLSEEGLVVKLGAFDNIIADKNLSLKLDATNLKGKTLTTVQVDGEKKRQDIMNYQEKIKSFTDSNFHKPKEDQNWKKLIHQKTNSNKQLHFNKKTIQEASNPLILMKSKDLKKDLSDSEKKYTETIKNYSTFYQNIDKAMKMDYLSKRKFSQPNLGIKKNKKIAIQAQYE